MPAFHCRGGTSEALAMRCEPPLDHAQISEFVCSQDCFVSSAGAYNGRASWAPTNNVPDGTFCACCGELFPIEVQPCKS